MIVIPAFAGMTWFQSIRTSYQPASRFVDLNRLRIEGIRVGPIDMVGIALIEDVVDAEAEIHIVAQDIVRDIVVLTRPAQLMYDKPPQAKKSRSSPRPGCIIRPPPGMLKPMSAKPGETSGLT